MAEKVTNDFDAIDIVRQLTRLRAKHGAETPIGHRCSNLIEQLWNLRDAIGNHRDQLEKNISRQIADLEALNADHHHTNQ